MGERSFQLMNAYFVCEGAFKYKEKKNLAMNVVCYEIYFCYHLNNVFE